MNKSWLESPYLPCQLRLGLLSLPVSFSLNISPIGFDELEGRIYPRSSERSPRAIEDDTRRWAAEFCEWWKEDGELRATFWHKNESNTFTSELTFTLQELVEWLSPCHNIINRSPAEEKCHNMYILSNTQDRGASLSASHYIIQSVALFRISDE